jgi:hypothetical protein
MALTIAVEPHPLLDVGSFVIRCSSPLAERPTPAAIARLADPAAVAPITAPAHVTSSCEAAAAAGRAG